MSRPSPMPNPAPLALSARLDVGSTRLRVEYTLANSLGRAIYARVRPMLYGAVTRRPYSVLRDEGTLLLSYLPAPPPPGVRVYAPTPVYSRLIAPGERYEDGFELPAPVEERHPYCPLEYPPDAALVTATRVLFRTECFPADSVGNVRPANTDEPGIVYVWGGPRTLLDAAFDAHVPVLKRSDAGFYRFEARAPWQ